MSKRTKDGIRLSRRDLFKVGAAAGVAAVTGGGLTARRRASNRGPGARARERGKDRELVLVNGRIHTMDDRNRVVSSVTIRNGRFAEVGHGDRSEHARVIDLRGATVVPGLIESHTHFVSLANRPGYHVAQWELAANVAEVLAILRPAARAATCRRARSSPRWARARRTSGSSAASPRSPSSTAPCPTGRCSSTGRRRAGARQLARQGFLREREQPHGRRSAPTARSPAATRARRTPRSTTCGSARPSRTRSAARSTRWPTPPRSGSPPTSTRRWSRWPPARSTRARSIRSRTTRSSTSTISACTTRSSRCTPRARRSPGCR